MQCSIVICLYYNNIDTRSTRYNAPKLAARKRIGMHTPPVPFIYESKCNCFVLKVSLGGLNINLSFYDGIYKVMIIAT